MQLDGLIRDSISVKRQQVDKIISQNYNFIQQDVTNLTIQHLNFQLNKQESISPVVHRKTLRYQRSTKKNKTLLRDKTKKDLSSLQINLVNTATLSLDSKNDNKLPPIKSERI